MKVRTIRGVRVVEIHRASSLSAKEVGGIAVAGAALIVAYEVDQWMKSIGAKLTPQKNALGIPFGSTFPGGGANPMNYLVP